MWDNKLVYILPQKEYSHSPSHPWGLYWGLHNTTPSLQWEHLNHLHYIWQHPTEFKDNFTDIQNTFTTFGNTSRRSHRLHYIQEHLQLVQDIFTTFGNTYKSFRTPSLHSGTPPTHSGYLHYIQEHLQIIQDTFTTHGDTSRHSQHPHYIQEHPQNFKEPFTTLNNPSHKLWEHLHHQWDKGAHT